MSIAKHETRPPIGCLVALICFSGLFALTTYPYGFWRLDAAFGLLALFSIFVRVGWFVPLTIAGAYFGLELFDPLIQGGTMRPQLNETVGCIIFGAVVGFAFGATIDASRHARHRQITTDGTATADEQSVGHGAADDAKSNW